MSNINLKRMLTGLTAFALAAASVSCGGKETEPESVPAAEPVTEAPTEPETEAPTEEPTEPEPPTPIDCDDPNALTFDDGDCSFASAKTIDADSAQGIVEVAEIMGNPMLRFTDDGTNFANGTVQKIEIDAAKLLSHENVAKVRKIEFDVYADATASLLKTDEADNVLAPGWIGGGGGANCKGDVWQDLDAWEGGEYTFQTSGPVHGKFKFLLADMGRCWSEDMEEATFLIMRWGAKNEGNFYVDNIIFYDEDGNSLPIEKSGADSGNDVEEADVPETEEAPAEAEETEIATDSTIDLD